MGELQEGNFGAGEAAAWRAFGIRLGDHLAGLGEEEVLLVETRHPAVGDGAVPYVQVMGYGDERLRGEVSSNAWLAPAYRLTSEQEGWLAEAGWSEPTCGPEAPYEPGSPHWYVDMDCLEADRLAAMLVMVLRDVFGVHHPSLLEAGGLEDDPDVGLPRPTMEPAPEPDPSEPPITNPHDRDHLRELVGQAVSSFCGEPRRADEDGDYPFPIGTSVVFVHACEDQPVVELMAPVACDFTDPAAAEREVGILNDQSRFVLWQVRGRSIWASCSFPADPFVPKHLRGLLRMMLDQVAEHERPLQLRTGARAFLDREDDEDEVDDVDEAAEVDEEAEFIDEHRLVTAMGRVRELAALCTLEDDFFVELALQACEEDPDLVRELIGIAVQQGCDLRDEADDALMDRDRAAAEEARERAAEWDRVTGLLRLLLGRLAESAPRGTTAHS